MKRLMAMALIAALAAGCGATGESPLDAAADVRYLVVVDSIGVETGDSCYTFGGIEGVEYCPDGNIAVLDCVKAGLIVYSPQGEYLRRIGQRGNGPGELGNVAFLAMTEDGHILLAGEGSGILGLHQYEYSTGEWLGSIPSMTTPPTCIEGAEEDCHVRKDLRLDVSTGEPIVFMSASKYRFGSEEPVHTFFETSFPYDPQDIVGLVDAIWFGVDMAADFNGNTWISHRSSTEAVVVRYGPDGMEADRIQLDLEPVLRTPEELESERLILTTKAMIMDFDQLPPMEPDPYKPLITGVHADGDGNLWVQLGGPAVPEFRVFSPEGDFLYTVHLQNPAADAGSWKFCIGDSGVLAYADDPMEGYQKVYMLEMVQ